MSLSSKFKNNDGIISMYLVPKKMYKTLLSQLDEDEENKNELIAINQNQINNNNYIENAIAFKKQQSEQKKNTSTSNLQKPDMTDNQSTVTPNTLSRSVSTFRTIQPSAQSDIFPTNVSRNISLTDSESQTDNEQKKKSTTSTPVKRTHSTKQYRNSPILEAFKNRNSMGFLICPIQACKKQYPSEQKLATHLLKIHNNDLAVRERRVISETSQPSITSSLSSITQDTPKFRKDSNDPSKNTGAKKKLFPAKYPKL